MARRNILVVEDDELVNIPIVVVSACADQSATLNVNDVIKKPIDRLVLLSTVQKWCGHPKDGTV